MIFDHEFWIMILPGTLSF